METAHFHHTLKVMSDICTACSHCMRSCPTEAIRIKNGKAVISGNKCVDCGHCYNVCPSNAIYVEQDDFDLIFKYKYRIAIVPIVLFGQFQESLNTKEIFSTFKELGFTDVYEVENSVELLIDFWKDYIRDNPGAKPFISCFCPAIVRLIQVRFPSLTGHLVPMKQPLDLSAMYLKKKLIDEGIPEEEIGVFYISPCAAKIAAVKSPMGEEKSVINGVINMDLMYNRILRHINNRKEPMRDVFQHDQPTSKGILWPLTKGESCNMPGRNVAIDGMVNVIEFLEKLENDEISGFDFLELRACDESCAGGILTSVNRFLIVERLRKSAENIQKFEKKPTGIEKFRDYINSNTHIDVIQPRNITRLDEDTEKAIQKLQKVRKLMCFLPGFDCGVCGAPSCQALAEDIAKGEANISDCLFMQRVMEKNGKLSADHAYRIIEGIWGRNRLEKDCNKKGALK